MKVNATAALLLGLLPAATFGFPVRAASQIDQEGALSEGSTVRRITLEEALELLGSNLELQMARWAAAEAEGLARQSTAYPNPSFAASHEALDETGLELSESYFTLSQRVEWPGERRARQAVTKERAAEASFRVAADSAALGFRVKRAYVHSARVESQARVLERVVLVFRQAVESAEARYEQGDLSLYDLRRIDVERVRYEAALADALLDLGLARRELALLVAPQSGESALAPADFPSGMPPSLDLERLEGPAVARRPEMAATQARVRSVQAELRQTRAQRVPYFTANGGLKRQSDGFNGVFLGVSIPLPLWDRSGGAIEAVGARVAGEEARMALTRRVVEDDARRAVDEYRSHLRRAELLSAVVREPALDLLDVAQVAYEAGEMELIDLLDAARAFQEAEMAALRIQSEVWISYYDLERAIGGFGDLETQGEDG